MVKGKTSYITYEQFRHIKRKYPEEGYKLYYDKLDRTYGSITALLYEATAFTITQGELERILDAIEGVPVVRVDTFGLDADLVAQMWEQDAEQIDLGSMSREAEDALHELIDQWNEQYKKEKVTHTGMAITVTQSMKNYICTAYKKPLAEKGGAE